MVAILLESRWRRKPPGRCGIVIHGVARVWQAREKADMSLGSPGTFGLCSNVPDDTLDPEWHALVSQPAYTLAAMLQRSQASVARVSCRTDTIQALVAAAEQFLTAQAQEHVSLERELGQLRALVTELRPAPAELIQRVHRLACVLEVLHTNLAVARQWTLKLWEDARA